jgi:unsaturated glucuronylhydrolase
MKKITGILLGLAGLMGMAGSCVPSKSSDEAAEALDYCHGQVLRALEELKTDSGYDYTMMPRNILAEDAATGRKGWNCRPATPEEWCGGFWPGILWYDYEYSGDTLVRRQAERYTEALGYLADRPPFDHDLGFLVYCSYGNGYRLTGNPAYRDVIVRTARQLARLYNPRVGTILSWPREVEPNGWPHNTIMDNMINLEMLFFAARNGGGEDLRDMAVSHADTTMRYHFRPDGSCYHVAVYDTLTGGFIKGVTHQGYSDASMWARGQAWAIYGYTMVYRETREPRFLAFARKVTDIYLSRLGERNDDWVPRWDFDDPNPDAPKDASAACVVASALLELCTYIEEPEEARRYEDAARSMLRSLGEHYRSGEESVAFLKHSTGHHPNGSEINASIIYADYYYIEALHRLRNLPVK